MMAIYRVQRTLDKGLGVFAARDIGQGEHIFHVDLREFKRYTLDELEHEVHTHPELDGDHANYAGHGKYVIEDTPASYMNHSCTANCYFKMKSIVVYDVFAFRDIFEGEELTHDYTATSVDQFAGNESWILDCQCRSKNCRGKVTGDFFGLSEELQRKYYPHLPPSIKRKYRTRFRGLFKRTK
jgi:SET domain-containing protein